MNSLKWIRCLWGPSCPPGTLNILIRWLIDYTSHLEFKSVLLHHLSPDRAAAPTKPVTYHCVLICGTIHATHASSAAADAVQNHPRDVWGSVGAFLALIQLATKQWVIYKCIAHAVNMKLHSHTVSHKAQLSLCTLSAGKCAAGHKETWPTSETGMLSSILYKTVSEHNTACCIEDTDRQLVWCRMSL